MMRKWTFCLGMALIFLAGCTFHNQKAILSPSVAPSLTKGPTTTPQPASQQEQTTAQPTVTLTAITETLAPEVQQSKQLLQSECLPIHPNFSPEQALTQDLFVTQRNTAYILDLNAGSQTELRAPTGIAGENYFVSPDGNWLAYEEYVEGRDLLTVSPMSSIRSNQTEPSYPWRHSQPFEVQGWFRENTLLLTRLSTIQSDTTADISTVILNPFTQEEQEFNLGDYPNYKRYKEGGVGSYLFGQSNLLPDPTLTRLIYPEEGDRMYYLTLWDLENQRPLVKLDFFINDIWNNPLWSPDGKDVLVREIGLGPEDGGEWFLVTREGNVRQLTYFSRFPPGGYKRLASRSWDGRYLAFQWVYPSGGTPKDSHAKYFIVDLVSPTLEGFCVDMPLWGDDFKEPVWSADNRYLAISSLRDNLGDLILVDVEKRQAYQIAKDVVARGWVARP